MNKNITNNSDCRGKRIEIFLQTIFKGDGKPKRQRKVAKKSRDMEAWIKKRMDRVVLRKLEMEMVKNAVKGKNRNGGEKVKISLGGGSLILNFL